jgi:hypothetical protein
MTDKYIELKDKGALIAFIYDRKTPPTAVVHPVDEHAAPICVHSLRENGLDFFDQQVTEKRCKKPWRAYPRFKDFPSQSFTCVCGNHKVNDSAEHCFAEVPA